MFNLFLKYKFVFYLCNFILIILYLYPGSILGWFLYNNLNSQPQITSDLSIWSLQVSTNHVYAFLVLSIIGFLSYAKLNQIKILSIYLIFLSIILELLHLFIPQRGFQLSDLLGNIIGVIVIIFLFYPIKKNENF
tara:strand:- start:999 stop:1403 length:405 start_codon:yes stop_codon:yes gene_type:complete